MKYSYFKDLKVNMIYFDSGIRKILGKLEGQYDCMNDPDLFPEKPFDKFFDQDLYKQLNQLEEAVENRTDLILHKGR